MARGGGFAGGKGSHEMAAHGIAIGDGKVVGALDDEAAGGAVFIGHGDGTEIDGPAVAVAGIPGIVSVAGEVTEAELIEIFGVALADIDLVVALPFGHVGVEGVGGRGEVVAGVSAHFVEIHHHLRMPFEHGGDAAFGFGLGHGDPVAVHVEEVMVGATAGPGFGVFSGERVGVGLQAFALFEALDEAVAPVGILHGIYDDEVFGEDGGHEFVIAGGEEVVGGHDAGVSGGDLIAVHAVRQPDDDGQGGDGGAGGGIGGPAGVCEAGDAVFDLGEAGDVGLGADDGVDELAAFPGFAVFDELHAAGFGGGEGFEVADDV